MTKTGRLRRVLVRYYQHSPPSIASEWYQPDWTPLQFANHAIKHFKSRGWLRGIRTNLQVEHRVGKIKRIIIKGVNE